MPQIREWVGRMEGRVGGLTMLSDTGDQAVCTVGQTDSHSSPDHTTRRADVEWNSFGPQATLLMHPSGPHSSLVNQTAFFLLYSDGEKRVWCNSVAFFVLSNLQIFLEMLIVVDGLQRFVNKVRMTFHNTS